jgi:hypothetical protein
MTVSRGVELLVDSLGMTTAFRYLLFLVSAYLFLGAFTFFIVSRSILRMRNVSDKSYRESQNTPFNLNNFFFLKSYHL